VAEKIPSGTAPTSRFAPCLRERLRKRRSVGDRRNRENDPGGEVVVDRSAMDQFVDRQAHGQAEPIRNDEIAARNAHTKRTPP
jgi:hypothetical protein